MQHRTSHVPGASGDTDVVAWRRRRLEAAGFERVLAASLGADPRTDVHALLDLVDRGCRPDLAARILAPLQER